MIKLCYLFDCQQTVWRVKNNQQGTENGGEHVGLWFVIMVTSMSTVQFSWLCLHPYPPPPALYVHRQARGEKGLGAARFPATTHRFPSITEPRMSTPCPQGGWVPLSSTLPQPTCTHPPIRQYLLLPPCSLIQRVKAPPEWWITVSLQPAKD